MVAAGEDELICDFAQTYHVLHWRGLPPLLAATLAAGLPEDSRVKRRISGAQQNTNTLLLAHLADSAALLLWRYAKSGTPKPQSFVELLTGTAEPEPEIRVFRSGADFDRALARFVPPQSPPAAATAPPKGTPNRK